MRVLICTGVVCASFVLGCTQQATPSEGMEEGAPSKLGDEKAAARVLVFTKTMGFRHTSIPDGIQCVREILRGTAEVEATEDSSRFNDQDLARFSAVVFLSTTGDVLDPSQQSAFQRFIERGGGFAGIHAASDTEHDWPWFTDMIGARFIGHPPVQSATIIVEDRTHESTRRLPPRWERTDEWYRFHRNPRAIDGIHVLASLDESTFDGGGMDGDHPCAWWRKVGRGRCWYTAGGHTEESFQEPLFREHLRGGILWACGVDPVQAQ